jgi:hypothetical protein
MRRVGAVSASRARGVAELSCEAGADLLTELGDLQRLMQNRTRQGRFIGENLRIGGDDNDRDPWPSARHHTRKRETVRLTVEQPDVGDDDIDLVSGYADTSALESAVGNAPLLRKPFRPGELAAAVRDAIDKP